MEPNRQTTARTDKNSNASGIEKLTAEKATESNALEIPTISLPKGGGALKGIDEKFKVNSANGTAGFSIPLPVTPGRNGFSPELSLSYSSGAGNGSYGLGWSLEFATIQRKTDKRLPRYRDALDEDVFMFSGAEDLVPYLELDTNSGAYVKKESVTPDGYTITRYRPRIEGGFARIEKIVHQDHGTYWKVTSGANIVTIFGRSIHARIAHPEDHSRIFMWLPEFSYDSKGNWMRYGYKQDTNVASDGNPLSDVQLPDTLFEKNRRSGLAPFTNTYLKSIGYGNQEAYYADDTKPYDPQDPESDVHFFDLIFDYGEHNEALPTPAEERPWEYRSDSFSSYRSGFEIRTNRLCRRILMFHHFEEEKQFKGTAEEGDFGRDYLVRSLELFYGPSSINGSGVSEVTYLNVIKQSGYIRKPDGTYSIKSLPELEFDYQRLSWGNEIKVVDAAHIANTPVGLSNNYQWVDLYNEGIPGILTEEASGWFYKNNLGDVDENGRATFAPMRKVAERPSFSGLSTGVLSLRDLESNGEKQLVVASSGVNGFFELTDTEKWTPLQHFEQMANIDLQDPNTRLLDLNGDGRPELVITEENAFVWYASDGKQGYLPAEFAEKTFDQEKGPAIVFADGEQTIFLADMSGDGLTDIVRIRNGAVSYWANKGYGVFSARIAMSNAPLFDRPDQFDPRYLHLADVSGTGATDLIYLGENSFKAYINLSGNAWSDEHLITPTFPMGGGAKLSVVDLLGSGTSCVVWSSDLPSDSGTPMRYIDLMNGKKPHVLQRYKNNLGKETYLEYKSATHYYIKDKLAGTPWLTKLPFPVQVLSAQTTVEKVTNVRFRTTYSYHHGYFDHAEREFRGFGRVEQQDTEYYNTWAKNVATDTLEQDPVLYQPPVLTKTWYHTGAFLDREQLLSQFKKEYWYELYKKQFPQLPLNVPSLELPNITISDTVDASDFETLREAFRACKGMAIRQEVFALDAPENPTDTELQRQWKPFTVASHTCSVRSLQPKQENRYAVFLPTQSETLNVSYERLEEDPRIGHTFNLAIDELGKPLETASVVYPRQIAPEQHPLLKRKAAAAAMVYEREDEKQAYIAALSAARNAQATPIVTYTKNTYTGDVVSPAIYRLRTLADTQTFELTGMDKAKTPLLTTSDFETVEAAAVLDYFEEADPTIFQKRLIERVQTTFYDEALLQELHVGTLASHGITYQRYQLAYTATILNTIFGDKLPVNTAALEAIMGNGDTDSQQADAKFSKRDGHWWIRSGITDFLNGGDPSLVKNRFFSPQKYQDPFGADTSVSFYKDYFLMMDKVTDALGKEVRAMDFNFRTLSPMRMQDANNNLSGILLDEIGSVKAVAVMGKGNEADSLEGITEFTDQVERTLISEYFVEGDSALLEVKARALLQKATTRFVYDFDSYKNAMAAREAQDPNILAMNPCKEIGAKPTVNATILRERHIDPDSPLQLSFEYSDGMGNIAMAKAQAAPGEALELTINDDCTTLLQTTNTGDRLRWIGNGRTVLNNKGNPVKQYEPYFSVNPFYENAMELVERGVTPITYYDAMGRVIKTEFPDGTFSKTEFDSWQQRVYDQNDTVADSRWYADRKNGQLGEAQKSAAEKTLKHNNTPTILCSDTLGRTILSIAHNRAGIRDNQGGFIPQTDEFYATYIVLDAEGNTLSVIDAKGNTVMAYLHDMLGHRVYQNSMDAGERWMLNNAMGNPVKSWDSRNHVFSYEYDELQRAVRNKVSGGANNLDHVYEVLEYGDRKNQPTAERTQRIVKNMLGQLMVHKDTSGITTFVAYDFKGNILEHRKQLLKK